MAKLISLQWLAKKSNLCQYLDDSDQLDNTAKKFSSTLSHKKCYYFITVLFHVCDLAYFQNQKRKLSKYTFLIIICSIFVQSSDWLVATAISHYYLLNFSSKL